MSKQWNGGYSRTPLTHHCLPRSQPLQAYIAWSICRLVKHQVQVSVCPVKLLEVRQSCLPVYSIYSMVTMPTPYTSSAVRNQPFWIVQWEISSSGKGSVGNQQFCATFKGEPAVMWKAQSGTSRHVKGLVGNQQFCGRSSREPAVL